MTPSFRGIRPSTRPGAVQAEVEADVEQGYARLQALTLRIAQLELERVQVLRGVVAQQVEADVAQQALRVAAADERTGQVVRATSCSREQLVAEAVVAVTDTATVLCSGSRHQWAARVRFATAPVEVTLPVRRAVAGQVLTFEQGCALVTDTDLGVDLPAPARADLIESVLTHARARLDVGGSPVSQQTFRARLRRELLARTDSSTRRRRALDRRGAWVDLDDDGAGTLTLCGADARCLGAYRRIDAIARAVRAGGDARTLAQLRSDVALDLLTHGIPAEDAATSVDAPAHGGWPAARVHVVGIAMPVAVDSYRPPAALARAVTARDGQCRAPGCTRPPSAVDLDHVIARRDGGPTSGDNLQALCRAHHSKKTRRHWHARLDPDCRVTWTLPGGTQHTTLPMDYRDLDPHLATEPPADGDATARASEAATEAVTASASATEAAAVTEPERLPEPERVPVSRHEPTPDDPPF